MNKVLRYDEITNILNEAWEKGKLLPCYEWEPHKVEDVRDVLFLRKLQDAAKRNEIEFRGQYRGLKIYFCYDNGFDDEMGYRETAPCLRIEFKDASLIINGTNVGDAYVQKSEEILNQLTKQYNILLASYVQQIEERKEILDKKDRRRRDKESQKKEQAKWTLIQRIRGYA